MHSCPPASASCPPSLHRFALPLLFAFGVMLIDCDASVADQPPATNEPKIEDSSRVPDWFDAVPSEPGRAFYGAGAYAFQQVAADQMAAVEHADHTAAERLAADLQKKLHSVEKQFMRSVLTPEYPDMEQRLTQQVLDAITAFARRNAVVVMRRIARNPNGPGYIAYTLARIGFDDVAETLHAENQRATARLPGSMIAYDELDKFLMDEQRKDGERAPPADMALPRAAAPNPK